MGLRALIEWAATERGLQVDVDRACRALEAAAGALKRRQARRQPSLGTERQRLRRATAGLAMAEDALGGLERDAANPRRYATLRAAVERQRGQVEGLLASAQRSARPGPPRDDAARSMVREVAWILHREGLTVSAYPEGLLAEVARGVAALAGRRLGEDIRRLLRPAVKFIRAQGGQVPAISAPDLSLVNVPTPGAPYRQTH